MGNGEVGHYYFRLLVLSASLGAIVEHFSNMKTFAFLKIHVLKCKNLIRGLTKNLEYLMSGKIFPMGLFLCYLLLPFQIYCKVILAISPVKCIFVNSFGVFSLKVF